MFIKLKRKARGWTLLEMVFAVAVFSLASAAVATAYIFSLRSFQGLSNYSVLDQQNREAVDTLTREIRGARQIKDYTNSANSYLRLVDRNNAEILYTINNSTKQLLRTSNNVSTVLLNNCSLIQFGVGSRPYAQDGTFTPTTNVNQIKVVYLTWKTGRSLPNGVTNSENIQTAQIVLRNKP